ncbi:MAG: 4'-phosphopantetheinyl transferase superfamily protein [Bacteroidota bacterium]
MPLLLHKQLSKGGEYAIWEITESSTFFQERLSLAPLEISELDRIKGGGKKLEWLSSRYLLHLMSGRTKRGALIKDEFGKPHLEQSTHQVSLSHSNGRSAAMAAPYNIGIDIQKIVAKIERIAHKFMRPEEMESLQPTTRLEQLHIYWGAKEALYKAYGRKELDFRKHLKVTPIYVVAQSGQTTATIQKDTYQKDFKVNYEIIDNYIIVRVAAIAIEE